MQCLLENPSWLGIRKEVFRGCQIGGNSLSWVFMINWFYIDSRFWYWITTAVCFTTCCRCKQTSNVKDLVHIKQIWKDQKSKYSALSWNVSQLNIMLLKHPFYKLFFLGEKIISANIFLPATYSNTNVWWKLNSSNFFK